MPLFVKSTIFFAKEFLSIVQLVYIRFNLKTIIN
jgi:hypothetical protein